jgi:putative ABC transport system permease protein
MNNFWRDARFGLRLLGKNKGFTLVAVLALALGIGPNTAIFSVIHATLLAPMPYPDPDQLVVVWSKIGGSGRNVVSAGDFTDWKKESRAFQMLGAASGGQANLASATEPEQVHTQLMTPGLLGIFGYTPALGRADFLDEEGQNGRDHVVILSNRLWKRRFGSDLGIVGRQIRMNSQPFTVVGVLQPGQADRLSQELWMPMVFKPEQINHDFHWLIVLGRMKPGVTLKQAQADMDGVARHVAEIYPKSNKNWGASVEPLQNDFLDSKTRTSMWLLLGAVGFVLLIACVNVANLLLARGTSRQKEVAVRASLGATRSQLFRQLLTESLALAAAGGVLGVGLGWALLKAVMALMPRYTLPSEAEVRLSLPVLLFTLAATALAGTLFGCAPAWQATRLDLIEPLKEGGRSISGGRHRLRQALVVVEFALALTLLTGAGLAIHSFWNQTHADLGVRTDHVLTFSLPVPSDRFSGAQQINTFYRQMLEKISAVPGVQSATAATGMPLDGAGMGMPFSIAGKPVSDLSARPGAAFQMVTPEYYRTFGVQLVRGRAFNDQDTAGSVRVAMVSETFVRRFLPGVDPLRQRILVEELIPGVTKLGPAQDWQIVGVFGDVRSPENLRDSGDGAQIDVPFSQSPWPQAVMAVRTAGDPAAMQKSIAGAVHSVDPTLPLADVRTMDQVVEEHMAGDRFSAVLYVSFAGVALFLAAVGIYGVMAFAVAQRTHEIGLRMALGAGRTQVLGLVLREGMALAVAGLAVGLAGAWFVGRAMQSMLYGTGAIDFTALGTVAAVLLISALLACWLPARRATTVDPMIALRAQ